MKARDLSQEVRNPEYKASLAATIATYDAIAEDYYMRTKAYDADSDLGADLDDFVSRLQGRVVLDAGAGSCRDTVHMLKHGLHVEAVDMAVQLLMASSKFCPNYVKRVMDIQSLGYRDATFDGVWCSAVLLHLNRDGVLASLHEFHRVLRPTGILHVSVKEGSGTEKVCADKQKGLYRYFYLYQPKEISSYLEQAGFIVVSMVRDRETDSSKKHVTWIRCLANKADHSSHTQDTV